MKFKTDYKYVDRKTKAKYVWLKYQEVLNGKILDVGADKCHLKSHLAPESEYIGIGLGGNPDIQVDLEKERIPFETSSFNVVLCLDVLEHLENIHDTFDELCRVTKKYVIISLPNPYSAFQRYLMTGNYRKNSKSHLKFYGLPFEKPEDRHKWFFSTEEAEMFVSHKAKENNLEIIQIDLETEILPNISLFKKILLRNFFKKYYRIISNRNLFTGTLWAILRKK